MTSGFFVYLDLSFSLRAALSDGACESDIRTTSEKICEHKVQYNRKYPTMNKSVQLEPNLGKFPQNFSIYECTSYLFFNVLGLSCPHK